MPAFIANAFPELSVEVVEIDDVVVDAAESARLAGHPRGGERGGAPEGSKSGKRLENLSVVIGDAAEFMASAAGRCAAARRPRRVRFSSTRSDGDGETRVLDLGVVSARLRGARRARGVVVANCFNGVRGSKARRRRVVRGRAGARDRPVTSWTVETPVNAIFAARKERASDDGDDVSDLSVCKNVSRARSSATPRARSAPSACSSGTRAIACAGRSGWRSWKTRRALCAKTKTPRTVSRA